MPDLSIIIAARQEADKKRLAAKEANRRYKLAHPDRIKRLQREGAQRYRLAHPDRVAEQARRYREKYPDRLKATRKKYYLSHGDKLKADRKRRYDSETEKSRAYANAWYFKNKKTVQARKRFAKYGIEGAAVDAMWAKQDGKCAACERPFSTAPTSRLNPGPSLDHDHETGRIRGLLCQGCNLALGNAGESVDVLRGLIRYIQVVCGIEGVA